MAERLGTDVEEFTGGRAYLFGERTKGTYVRAQLVDELRGCISAALTCQAVHDPEAAQDEVALGLGQSVR